MRLKIYTGLKTYDDSCSKLDLDQALLRLSHHLHRSWKKSLACQRWSLRPSAAVKSVEEYQEE
jgi:hypothetical protein